MKIWKHYVQFVNEILPIEKRVEAIRKQLESHETHGIDSPTVSDLKSIQ